MHSMGLVEHEEMGQQVEARESDGGDDTKDDDRRQRLLPNGNGDKCQSEIFWRTPGSITSD